MDSLRSILPKVLRKRGLHAHAVASMVTFRSEKWLRESLPRLKDAIAVRELADAVLTIECENGIAQQECCFQLPALTAYLSRECPETPLREIRVIRRGRKRQNA